MEDQDVTYTETEKRILEAAGRTFAESGYRHATVREICARAGVNVAAVNYHFRDKKNLYFVTLRHWQSAAFRKYPPELATDRSKPAEERLKAFIHQFLSRILDEGETSWFGKIMAREVMEPSGGLDMVVKEGIRPLFDHLSSIVRELIQGRPSPATVRLCAASVVGQCLYFVHAKPVIKRLFPAEAAGALDKEAIASHVTRFSVSAIKSFASSKKGEKRR
jgi:TetR/AcrR family transcriptional regulator, regulator of cefoperazone and chloramphenicol sensitivity